MIQGDLDGIKIGTPVERDACKFVVAYTYHSGVFLDSQLGSFISKLDSRTRDQFAEINESREIAALLECFQFYLVNAAKNGQDDKGWISIFFSMRNDLAKICGQKIDEARHYSKKSIVPHNELYDLALLTTSGSLR